MTIYEKITSLSIEEMAQFLTDEGFRCDVCEAYRIGNKDERCDEKCRKHCLNWLNKPQGGEK